MKFPDELSLENISSLEQSVKHRIQQITKDRRIQGPVSTTGLTDQKDYDGVNFSCKQIDLITLILLCWFSNEFNGFEGYILYEVREYLERNLLFPNLSAMTNSKELCLLVFFLPCQCNTKRFLFGQVLQPSRVERVIKSVRLKWVFHRRPKRTVRHRGYRDHGTLRPSDRWIERFDSTFVEEQMNLEEKRSRYHHIETLLVRAAGEWYLRNNTLTQNLKEEQQYGY